MTRGGRHTAPFGARENWPFAGHGSPFFLQVNLLGAIRQPETLNFKPDTPPTAATVPLPVPPLPALYGLFRDKKINKKILQRFVPKGQSEISQLRSGWFNANDAVCPERTAENSNTPEHNGAEFLTKVVIDASILNQTCRISPPHRPTCRLPSLSVASCLAEVLALRSLSVPTVKASQGWSRDLDIRGSRFASIIYCNSCKDGVKASQGTFMSVGWLNFEPETPNFPCAKTAHVVTLSSIDEQHDSK